MHPYFSDRREAGQMLTKRLDHLAGLTDLMVLALPRGGVPIGFEIAQTLRAPLDVFLVRKLGAPFHEELAIGALAENRAPLLNQALIAELGLSTATIAQITEREQRELKRRMQLYRGNKPSPNLGDRTIIIVDDGLATGATMKAATFAIRKQHPKKIIVVVPVGASDSCKEISRLVDELICLFTPEPFHAVGMWYQDFAQVEDNEVIEILELARLAL